jgi:hypothetical protein
VDDLTQNLMNFLTDPETLFYARWASVAVVVLIAFIFGIPEYQRVTKALQTAGKPLGNDRRITTLRGKWRRIGAYLGVFITVSPAAVRALFAVVALPLAMLVLITLKSDWFFGQPTVTLAGDPLFGSPEYIREVVLYFGDQLSKAMFLDSMEIRAVNFSTSEVNQANWFYVSALIGFRAIVDVYVVGLGSLILQAVWGTLRSIAALLWPF